MKMTKGFILLYIAVSLSVGVDSSKDLMTDIALDFVSAVHVCSEELNLPDSLYDDFTKMWKEDFEITDRNTGCIIHCLSSKLDLLHPDGNLHHENAHAFAQKHGADDAVAQKLVTLIHNCENTTPPNSDICLKVLAVLHCFKLEINELDWAPNMDIVLAEVWAEF